MKKNCKLSLIITISISLLVLFLITACGEVNTAISNTNGYYIPSFTTNKPGVKGISSDDFSTNNSLQGMEDSGVAGGVISFMPLFTDLEIVNKTKLGYIDTIVQRYGSTDAGQYSEIIYAYGLPCRIVFNDGNGNPVSHGADSGQYLYYEILDPTDLTTVIGYFDFYCDGSKFCYRDMLLVDLNNDENTGSHLYNSSKKRVFVREFTDVPVTLGTNNNPTFNIGRLSAKNKGDVPVFVDDNLFDQFGINLNTRNNGANNSCFAVYYRDVATINSKGDIISAFVRCDSSIYEELDEVLDVSTGGIVSDITDSVNNPLIEIFAKNVNSEWEWDDSKSGDLAQAYSGAELIYADAAEIKNHIYSISDSYVTYSSYDDYKDVSYKTRVQILEDNLKTPIEKFQSLLAIDPDFYKTVSPNITCTGPDGKATFFVQLMDISNTTLDSSTIIDVKKKKAVSSCSNEIYYPTIALCFDKTTNTYKGFEEYYPSIKNKNDTVGVISELIDKHLKACGINDENYIKNYTTSIINSPLFFSFNNRGMDDTRMCVFILKPITCEKHKTWESSYFEIMNKLIADLVDQTPNPYYQISPIPGIDVGGTLTYYYGSTD